MRARTDGDEGRDAPAEANTGSLTPTWRRAELAAWAEASTRDRRPGVYRARQDGPSERAATSPLVPTQHASGNFGAT